MVGYHLMNNYLQNINDYLKLYALLYDSEHGVNKKLEIRTSPHLRDEKPGSA